MTLMGVFFLRKSNNYQKFIYMLGSTLICISIVIFPWALFSKTPLNIIQFPWRILPFGMLLITFYWSSQNEIKQSKIYSCILISGIVLMTSISTEANFVKFQNRTMNASIDYTKAWRNLLGNKSYEQTLSKNYNYASAVTYTDYFPQTSTSVADSIFRHVMLVNDQSKEINYKNIKSIYQGVRYNIDLTEKNNKIVLPFLIYDKNNYDLYINEVKNKILVTEEGETSY